MGPNPYDFLYIPYNVFLNKFTRNFLLNLKAAPVLITAAAQLEE
jgi:hypothetical protein